MSLLLTFYLAPDSQHTCNNCRTVIAATKLKPIEHFFDRVEPGSIVPSGECPKCGALCYPNQPERKQARDAG